MDCYGRLHRLVMFGQADSYVYMCINVYVSTYIYIYI